MGAFLYVEINLIGFIILSLLLIDMLHKRNEHFNITQKIFYILIVVDILILIFDSGMWICDGSENNIIIKINEISTILYYLLNPVICFLWLLYTDYKLHENRKRIFVRMRLFIIPLVINTICVVITPFTGLLYTFDETNHYVRGSGFVIMVLCALLYLAYAIYTTIVDIRLKGWVDNKKDYFYLLFFPIIMIAIAILQSLLFGISVIWASSVLIILTIYLNLQNDEISTDYLTGLYNRRKLDKYINLKLRLEREHSILFAILIDVDDFKKINDTYGHMVGDKALIHVSRLLKACVDLDDFIARLGGDEFMIIGERKSRKKVGILMRDLDHIISEFNRRNKVPYTLKLSLGYSIYEDDNCKSIDEFIQVADARMYNMKKKKKEVN